jgi:hypothetical protein
MRRRNLLQFTAAATVAVGPAMARGTKACPAESIRSRPSGPVEIVYKAPHGQPNAMTAGPNPGELWVADKGIEHKITLIGARDGTVIREIAAPGILGPSGIALDDSVMWIGSTHGVMLVAVDLSDGRTLAKYFAPGSCRLFAKRGDPPHRVSSLKAAYPDESRDIGDPNKHNEGNDTGWGLGAGKMPLDTKYAFSATGPTGVLVKGNTLIYANLSARAIYVIDKTVWEVEAIWPTPGNRPYGMTWADASRESFWNADANLNALYRFNVATGQILESIVLPDGAPVLHGCQIMDDFMYYCDDMGWICRFRM